ncbi:DUF4362 domain-containing protein [Paenibacillus sp. PR3]|uniref:DUF4362 domain-containing protein n=1 Tax=Paenibacillus terricola TaxID=2763503 RepID=A0ABR8MYV8_9BACL|nr:DUF4362 domain-containing protein [Paenibacillus terricola]MBD3920257.1 DUF4362 domain-containing protein [Paenibacillus terricola]
MLGPLPTADEAISYTHEKALANGDVVLTVDQLMGLEHWERFYTNYKLGTPDRVRITMYSLEGAPIYFELAYDGDHTITYTFDDTMDISGLRERISTACRSIVSDPNVRSGVSYELDDCKDDRIRQTFRFTIDDVLPLPAYFRN